MLAMIQTIAIYLIPWLFVLTLVVTFHELGHFLVARAMGIAVDRFSIGFGRALLRWTDRSGVEWRIGWIPLGGYVKFAGDNDASSAVPDEEDLASLKRKIRAQEGAGAERRYFHFKPVWQRALVVAAGPIANFVLSIVIFAALLMAFGSIVVKPRVGAVLPGSAAQHAGFRVGDVVLSADGTRISDFSQLSTYVALRANQPIRFVVQRGAADLMILAAPQREVETDPFMGSARIGVLGLKPSIAPGDIYRKRYDPPQAIAAGAERTWTVLHTTVFYLGRVIRGLESADQLGGPIRTLSASRAAVHSGAEGAKTLGGKLLGGTVALLSLAAILSVSIGFMNLLPVPILDGGHLLFYAYEAAVRRPLAAKVQAAGYRIGLALLLGLMLFATWNDLQRLNVLRFLGGLFS